MAQRLQRQHYDVAVIGGGSAGLATAAAAAKNGARTVLIESGPMIGGELLSGIPIDGCLSSRGEWIVGGIARELFEECARLDGYIGPVYDWRTLWVVCADPEVMKIAAVNLVRRYGVSLLLYTFAEDVVVRDGTVEGVVVINKNQRTLITADVFVDCSGDGDVAMLAGADYHKGGPGGELQPVSMVFRMMNVDTEELLTFVRDHPENVGLGEHPMIGKTKAECAEELYKQGYAKVFFEASGPLLKEAIESGELFPCSMLAVTPISLARKEVSLNTTRLAQVDATDTTALSRALPDLLEQVRMGVEFLRKRVPGFTNAHFAGLAPRIGVRETRRIVGEYTLNVDDVLQAKKRNDGVAKGGHELDIHGAGTDHRREQIKDGGSYDIPLGCLLPKGLNNVLVAGRCLSATREAHSTARVMGTCMAMGQAAGTLAAMSSQRQEAPRTVRIQELRSKLKEQGAVLDGTY